MRSIAYVTTRFPTTAWFIEAEVHRLVAAGVRVRVYTLRGPSRHDQPEHAVLLPFTVAVGSPFDGAAWGALLHWLLRRPHVLVPEFLRMVWASRTSLYALAHRMGQAALQRVVREFDFERNVERFRARLGPGRAPGEPALPSRGAA